MIAYLEKRRCSIPHKILRGLLAFAFLFSVILPPAPAFAQTVLNLPVPGTMVPPSPGFAPALMTGVTIHPDNPLRFDFIMDRGQSGLTGDPLKEEYTKMIKYFMASLTVPEDELWVNLSPYEKDRMIAEGLGKTEMGRDMLAQDYLLKQLTASLMYPEKELGKTFWDRVYKKAKEQFGTTEIPVNTFNKVWIVPDEALVYEQGTSAFVIKSRLAVMLEQDYLAANQGTGYRGHGVEKQLNPEPRTLSPETEIIREIIIPEIEKEVNEGKNFANLRQIYNALILATWYKQRLKDSLLGKVYVNRNKTKGIDTQDKGTNQKIYNQYIESFQKGVYNFIKEDVDPATQEVIPRKYFSGGMNWRLALKTLGAFALGTWLGFGEPDIGNASALTAAAMAGTRDGVTTEFVDNGEEGNIGTAITVRPGVEPLLLAQAGSLPMEKQGQGSRSKEQGAASGEVRDAINETASSPVGDEWEDIFPDDFFRILSYPDKPVEIQKSSLDDGDTLVTYHKDGIRYIFKIEKGTFAAFNERGAEVGRDMEDFKKAILASPKVSGEIKEWVKISGSGASSPVGRVLLVDDDPNLVSDRKKQLERNGYIVTASYNGAEAWQAFQNNPFDLVLTDYEMPNVDGPGLISRIRTYEKEESRPTAMPIIMVSADITDEKEEKAQELGVPLYSKVSGKGELRNIAATVKEALKEVSSSPVEGEKESSGPLKNWDEIKQQFETLIDEATTQDELKRIYRKIAHTVHPDKVSAGDKEIAHRIFISLSDMLKSKLDSEFNVRRESTGAARSQTGQSDDWLESWSYTAWSNAGEAVKVLRRREELVKNRGEKNISLVTGLIANNIKNLSLKDLSNLLNITLKTEFAKKLLELTARGAIAPAAMTDEVVWQARPMLEKIYVVRTIRKGELVHFRKGSLIVRTVILEPISETNASLQMITTSESKYQMLNLTQEELIQPEFDLEREPLQTGYAMNIGEVFEFDLSDVEGFTRKSTIATLYSVAWGQYALVAQDIIHDGPNMGGRGFSVPREYAADQLHAGKIRKITPKILVLEEEQQPKIAKFQKEDSVPRTATQKKATQTTNQDLDVDVSTQPLVQFYLGLRGDHRDRKIQDMWGYDYDTLENEHDLIQMMFPSNRMSQVFPFFVAGFPENKIVWPQYVVKDVEIFTSKTKAGKLLRAHMLRSFEVMLNFYGFEYNFDNPKEVTIRRGSNFDKRRKVWLTEGNHNLLRIDRILNSLKFAGLEKYSSIFFKALKEVHEEYGTIIDASDSFNFWKSSVNGINPKKKLTLKEHKNNLSSSPVTVNEILEKTAQYIAQIKIQSTEDSGKGNVLSRVLKVLEKNYEGVKLSLGVSQMTLAGYLEELEREIRSLPIAAREKEYPNSLLNDIAGLTIKSDIFRDKILPDIQKMVENLSASLREAQMPGARITEDIKKRMEKTRSRLNDLFLKIRRDLQPDQGISFRQMQGYLNDISRIPSFPKTQDITRLKTSIEEIEFRTSLTFGPKALLQRLGDILTVDAGIVTIKDNVFLRKDSLPSKLAERE